MVFKHLEGRTIKEGKKTGDPVIEVEGYLTKTKEDFKDLIRMEEPLLGASAGTVVGAGGAALGASTGVDLMGMASQGWSWELMWE